MLKVFCFVFLLTWGLGGFAQTPDDTDSPAPVVVKTKRSSLTSRSLPHLVDLAMTNAPNIKLATDTYRTARLNYEVASAQWLPSLDFVTANGPTGTDPFGAGQANSRITPYNSTLDLTLTDNIYDNGVSFTKAEIAKDALDRARYEFEMARDQQLLDMAKVYYDWSSAIRERDILENKRDLLSRQYNVLEAQYKQGLKSKRDVIRIESEIKHLEIDIIRSDNLIDLNYQKLAAAIGVTRETLDKEDVESEEAKPYATGEIKNDELRITDHRKYRIYEIQKKEFALNTELARRNNLPQVLLTGEVGYHNHDYLANSAAPSWETNRLWDWQALLTLKYNIWDFGIRRKQIELAHLDETTKTEKNDNDLLALSNDLRMTTLDLRRFREDVRLTRELLVLEQQGYSILEAEYRNGHASYLDLITSLNALITARQQYNQSYYDLKKQQVTYYFHHSELYERIR